MIDKNFRLKKEQTGLLVIDVQDNIFSKMDRSCELLESLQKIVQGLAILQIPTFVTEHCPDKLGETIATLKAYLPENGKVLKKAAFSALQESHIKSEIIQQNIKQWIVVGIEAHVCVQQTVSDLLKEKLDVVVLSDAIGSRKMFDYFTSIAEMSYFGARISTVETILFELLLTSKDPEFKKISQLIKS